MALTTLAERQWELTAIADTGIAHIGTNNGITIALPPNALLISVTSTIVTPYNSGTSATYTVQDNATTPIVFLTGSGTAVAGTRTISTLGKFYPSGGIITASLVEGGAAATLGRALFTVNYVVVGRATEVQVN